MADRIRIECINKPVRHDPHRHITHVGGTTPNGESWRLTEELAIRGIKDGRWAFYVAVGDRDVEVTIIRTAQGREYLKTEADGFRPDNLLSLPECPVALSDLWMLAKPFP